MVGNTAPPGPLSEYGNLVKTLAFFAAARNYSYVDRLGNSLSYESVQMALLDALRDFKSTCIDSKPDPSDLGAYCPSVEYKRLEEEVARLLESLKRDTTLRTARDLALTALAESLKYVYREKPGGGSSEKEGSQGGASS